MSPIKSNKFLLCTLIVKMFLCQGLFQRHQASKRSYFNLSKCSCISHQMIPQDQESLVYERNMGLHNSQEAINLMRIKISQRHTSPNENAWKQILSLQFLNQGLIFALPKLHIHEQNKSSQFLIKLLSFKPLRQFVIEQELTHTFL